MKKQENTIPEITGVTQAQFKPEELGAMAQIIDIATRKGVFSAGDLAGVATVYQKILSYLPKGSNNG
jgi:hypothetical protein